MPLKLLKRSSNHYNVVSKSTFVISVTLLDNGIMECTLDANSTGTDCLHNISQRLALHQPEFFGLRYISRGVPPRQRWIELEEPLKKQLDKYAEDTRLSLGVMYYVSDVNVLKDEMTRYHYFLQLKSDVIDGKMNCSTDQAISLAAYSLQAEFGDYDPERHTVEYLRDFAILPKELTQGSQGVNVNAIFDAVARQYGSLLGFPPALAEIYYIMVAQQLDGYGQESYPAKDESGNDILLCTSVTAIVIRRRDWLEVATFRWRDIKSIMGHKRTLVLETTLSERSTQFHFNDAEVVKYVRKICALLSTFQKWNPSLQLKNPEYGVSTHSNYSSHSLNLENSSEFPELLSSNANLRDAPDVIKPAEMNRFHSLNNNLAHSSTSQNPSHFQMCQTASTPYRQQMIQQHKQIQQGPHRSLQELDATKDISLTTPVGANLMSNICDYGSVPHFERQPATSSCMSSVGDISQQPVLPSYRPAPDYHTAVQLNYCRQAESGALLEEPIYQNEIVSKIHSIDLRERTPVPLGTNTEHIDYGSIKNAAYLRKPPPPYPESAPGRFQMSHQQNTQTGTGSSFNSHSEVLKQIGSELQKRSLEICKPKPGGSGSHYATEISQATAQKQHQLINKPAEFDPVKRCVLPGNGEFRDSEMNSNHLDLKADSRDQYVSRHIDCNVMGEFQAIQKSKVHPRFAIGLKRENAKRNRTPNVLPYDDNSIRLTPTKDNADGYINASPISAQIGERIWKYTVGQIPLRGNGPSAFWQMIWETDSKIVVSLERDSSANFYPTEAETSIILTFGDFQVTNFKKEGSNAKSSIARELILTLISKKKQRRVWLLPYEDEWKHDVPVDTEHFLCFLEEVNSVQRKLSEGVKPLTVLCATGAGRCGVFVLSDLLLHAADTGYKIACDSLLSELRAERMLLVTHPTQYAFVLDTLAKYLAQSRLI